MRESDSNAGERAAHRDGRPTPSTADREGTPDTVDPGPANAAERAAAARAPFSDPMPAVAGERAPSERAPSD
jgi:hypothetical protein